MAVQDNDVETHHFSFFLNQMFWPLQFNIYSSPEIVSADLVTFGSFFYRGDKNLKIGKHRFYRHDKNSVSDDLVNCGSLWLASRKSTLKRH